MCKHLHRAVNIICLIALAQYTTLQQKNPLNQRASLFYLVEAAGIEPASASTLQAVLHT